VSRGKSHDVVIEVGPSHPSRLSDLHGPESFNVYQFVNPGASDTKDARHIFGCQEKLMGIGEPTIITRDKFSINHFGVNAAVIPQSDAAAIPH
jgi:hypothetical protein